MGCGGSKGDSKREPVASKLPPLLRRRLDEIKRRRNEAPDATISEKQLLKDGIHEDDHSSSHRRHHSAATAAVHDRINNDRSSLASAEEISVSVMPLIAEALSPEPSGFKDHEHHKSEEELQAGKADDTENNNHEERDHEEGENNGEESVEEGRLSNVEISYLRSNSPSFRVYCINEPENATDDIDNHKDDDYEQKTYDHDIAACVDSNEESMAMTKTKDKRKKGRGLRKPGAVKNLLNVTSCYHSRSRRDNPRLLASNAAA